MEKYIKKASKDCIIPKHHTSNMYARNILNGLNDKDDSMPSKADDVEDYMKERINHDDELDGMSLKQIRQRYIKRHQKSRKHSRALGYSDRNIGALRQATSSFNDRVNIIDPNASTPLPPRPMNLIIQQTIRQDENSDIERILDVLKQMRNVF